MSPPTRLADTQSTISPAIYLARLTLIGITFLWLFTLTFLPPYVN